MHSTTVTTKAVDARQMETMMPLGQDSALAQAAQKYQEPKRGWEIRGQSWVADIAYKGQRLPAIGRRY